MHLKTSSQENEIIAAEDVSINQSRFIEFGIAFPIIHCFNFVQNAVCLI